MILLNKSLALSSCEKSLFKRKWQKLLDKLHAKLD